MTIRGRRVDELSRRLSIDPDELAPDPGAAAPAAPPARVAAAAADPAGWSSALDDPAIVGGRNGHRSFYVDDAVFARFRAAIFWSARREDADDVPQNMSAAVETFMTQTAQDLEARYSAGAPFRPTPDQIKAARRRR